MGARKVDVTNWPIVASSRVQVHKGGPFGTVTELFFEKVACMANGQLKLIKRKWRPYRATKIDVLSFIRTKQIVTVHDLIDRFGYSYNGPVRRISLLHREDNTIPVVVSFDNTCLG